jgi:hypothetical protein
MPLRMVSYSIDNLYGAYVDPTKVTLGELFTEVKYPTDNYHKLPTAISVVKSGNAASDVSFTASDKFTGSFSMTISSLIGLDLSRVDSKTIRISFSKVEEVRLDQQPGTADELFDKLEVRKWVQQQWRRNNRVYFLIGYMVATGVHIESVGDVKSSTNATATISAAKLLPPGIGTLAALAVGNPETLATSVKAGLQKDSSGSLVLDVINPTVISIAYKEVHLTGTIRSTWNDRWKAKTDPEGEGHFHAKENFVLVDEATSGYLPTRG